MHLNKAGRQPTDASSFILYFYSNFYSFFAFFPCLKKQQGTDRETDGQMDTPSYRDARTHLKVQVKVTLFTFL